MKFVAILLTLFSLSVLAQENIYIQSPYSASHGGVPAYLKIVEEANKIQDTYKFHLEHRPGGQQIIAVNEMDRSPQDRLSIIAPKYVEHTVSGRLDRSKYDPIHALGDACWVVISNLGDETVGVASLQGETSLNVGGVGIGNATHLTSLQLGDQFGFDVNYVVFKSNYEGLILMAGDGSINLVVEKVKNLKQIKEKNPAIKPLATSCPTRHPDLLEVATLREQGVLTPFVFNITVANTEMPLEKRNALGDILNQATLNVGEETIQQLSDMKPPVFFDKDVDEFYNESIELIEQLLEKHADNIAKAKQG